MSLPFSPELSIAALIAAVPSCVALNGVRAPWKAPIGVRLAETMTTSFDMFADPLQCGARRLAPWPGANPPAGRSLGGGSAGARAEPVFEYGDKGLGDFSAGHGLIFPVPMGDPVERARERKGRHLRVARLNRAVLDAFTDEAADTLIDLRFERFDVAAHVGREVLFLRAHHAPAEAGGDGLAIVSQHRVQALACRHLGLLHFAEPRPDQFHAGHEAFEQELLLARDVVVDSGFGYIERSGDVIQRGVVITLVVECVRGGPDHGLALYCAFTHPLAVRAPGGCGRCAAFALGGRTRSAVGHRVLDARD